MREQPKEKDDKFKIIDKKCILCNKKYKGTRYQRWCRNCRVALSNNMYTE